MIEMVYVVLVDDRHEDTDVKLYRTFEAALNQANKEIPDNWDRGLDYEELGPQALSDAMQADGWMFYFVYSGEGDHVRIMRRELISEA